VSASSLSRGEVALTLVNSYTGVVIRSPHVGILVDPVDIDLDKISKIDAILITHEHIHHLDESIVADIQSNSGCVVIADSASFDRLSAVIPPNKLKEAHVKDEFQLEEASVVAEKSSHPAAEPLTYIITSEDGVSVFHSSDSAPFEEMADIGRRYQIDICLCSIGLDSGLSPRSGAMIAKLMRPKVAVPYHGEKTREFASALSKIAPHVKSRILRKGEILKYP